MTRLARATATLLLIPLVTGCGVIVFSKAGEDDAKAACSAVARTQGEGVSIEEGLAGLAEGAALAASAAEANDDYRELSSAMKAINESLFTGSEDLAQAAWEKAARICNDL
jgi:hypothetical protein